MGDYNPFENRPPEQRISSSFAVFMHLTKGAVGSGILFLPYAFKKAGYISAIICSICVGTILIHTAVITVKSSQRLCFKAKVPSLTFAEAAEMSFKLGPESVRNYATTFGVTTNVFVCFVQFQTAIVYSLYVATSFRQVIQHFTNTDLDVRIYLTAFMPFYCLMSLVPNFSYLVPFSLIGSICLFFGFFASLTYLLDDFPPTSTMTGFTEVIEVPIFCTVLMYAVHNMSMLMPLENSMKNPKKMAFVLRLSMILNICIYVIFGFLGYNKYRDTCDTVIKNLPLDDPLAQAVKISIAFSVMLTYALQYFVGATILWSMISKNIGDTRLHEKAFRVIGVILCTLLAIAVPQMAPLLGLFAALSMTTVMLCIPVLMELMTKWDELDGISFYLLILKNAFIALLFLVLLVFGTIGNLIDIVNAFSGRKTAPESELCD